MRSLVALVAILGCFVLFTDPAVARRVTIGGTHSSGEIKAKCAAVNGVFTSGSAGYGCTNDSNGFTSVSCDAKGRCHGWVPGRKVPKGGLTGVLGGGTGKTLAVRSTRVGGTQATHGAPPRSATIVRRCARHHC
jgi:hypothetical protein